MLGSVITRGLTMVFGYAYPAYECYKTVEMNKPDIELLRFWCQYWILVAMLTVSERIGDMFIGWLPMYSEAKLAFFIYLWFPKTKGTTYVYDSFFRPYVAKHETDIDRNLLELRTRAGDMAVLYWQKAASYGQTRIFEILQYIASQSTPRPAQQQQGARVNQPAAPPIRRSGSAGQPQNEKSASTASTSQHQEDAADESDSSEASGSAPSAPLTSKEQKTTPSQTQVRTETNKSLPSNKEEVLLLESSSSTSETAQPPAQDTVMEEAVRVTRARSRRPRGGSSR